MSSLVVVVGDLPTGCLRWGSAVKFLTFVAVTVLEHREPLTTGPIGGVPMFRDPGR